jgi:hypothetical protein
MNVRPGTRPVLRAISAFLLCLLGACQNQAPLPIEAAALEQELARRLDRHRQGIAGFEAEGSVTSWDAEGARSAADWVLLGRPGDAIELRLHSGASSEPVFALRASRDGLVTIWLHPPGGRETAIYEADRSDPESLAADPRLSPLRMLVQALQAGNSPGEFRIEGVEQVRNGQELIARVRGQTATAQVRLRRADAMPLQVNTAPTSPGGQGCLEVAFPEGPAIEAGSSADASAPPALALPAEMRLAWSKCCDTKAVFRLAIKLRSMDIGKPTLPDLPTGRTLPLKELPRNRLWKEFLRAVERDRDTPICLSP